MESKTKLFEVPDTVGWLDPIDPDPLILRQIYASSAWTYAWGTKLGMVTLAPSQNSKGTPRLAHKINGVGKFENLNRNSRLFRKPYKIGQWYMDH